MVTQNIDINKVSLKDLKAIAYDLISQLEQTQKSLNIINQQIKTMEDEKKVEPTEETPVEAVEATPAE